MGKLILLILLICAYIAVTFFGLGPVLLADGSQSERFLTLLVILALYGLLTLILVRVLRK
ncbi:DUF6954 family protein [Pseudalkalibacillus caeni]|uniref:DUF3955 domain-containing protein n=1 Tax=Exobacillus caeni TaxID=2574798 RepID=A0A5R9F2L5_9BACL|nr:hypothetical protein [Pseudalkalibacillus caeni]TLS35758.1 hypothetical protein FCL54_19080 [Pseudalkalibacillus caeni]